MPDFEPAPVPMMEHEVGADHLKRRIRVSAAVRLQGRRGEREALLVALSAQGGLVITGTSPGRVGDTVEVQLPWMCGKHIAVLSGIERIERVSDGYAVALAFIVAEPAVRKGLDALLELLLGGPGGGQREHPRVAHTTTIHYGELGRACELVDLSLGGLSMITPAAVTVGASTRVRLPRRGGHGFIELVGSAVSCRMLPKGYRVGLKFDDLSETSRTELATLLSDLLRR